MRSSQFLLAAIVAIATFLSLHYFLGNRYRGYFGWHRSHYWHHWDNYYEDDHYNRQHAVPYRQSDSLNH